MDKRTSLEKPRQSFAGLWNISFGFFGIQIGFALQNANMSRIFQSLGSSVDDLPAFGSLRRLRVCSSSRSSVIFQTGPGLGGSGAGDPIL